MKLLRLIAVVGSVHFVLWLLTYLILLAFDFDVLGPSQSPMILNIIYHLNHCLMFPLLLEAMRRVIVYWPLLPGVAIASCIWGICLSVAIRSFQRRRHVYVAY